MTSDPVRAIRPLLLMLAIAGTLGTACHDSSRPAPSPIASHAPSTTGWPRTLTDDSGYSLTLSSPPKRIVSLAPSNTEILFALGAGDRVVADTQSCDYPPEALHRPHVGGMSAGDQEKIQVQFPGLVVAVGSINARLITALRAAKIPTLVVQPKTIEDVAASVRLIGRATGTDREAERLTTEFMSHIDRVRSLTSHVTTRPKTLIAYSADPIYTSPPDSFIHDLIGIAGGTDIVQQPLAQNIISPAVVIERAPDVIICSEFLRAPLKRMPGWGVVPAVKNDRFFTTAGAELTRPGPRLAAGVEQLARALHPELFAPAGSRVRR